MQTSLVGHALRAAGGGPPHSVGAGGAGSPSEEELRRQAEIEQDMRLARDIQQGLLLEAVPRLRGWEISAISIPARDLGGDLYDFLPLGDGWHGIMIGDVSGKGLPAALRMAVARTVFRHAARRGEPPGPTLADTNRGVLSEIPQGMVTMLYALLDTRRGVLRVANAGHNYPVVINGQVAELELSGLPLGVDGDSEYEEQVATLDHGDTVVLYTDGVVETVDANEEPFGESRLCRLLAGCRGLGAQDVLDRVFDQLAAHRGTSGAPADDVTVVVLRRIRNSGEQA